MNSAISDQIGNLEIKVRKITDLKPYANNPRTHTAKQIKQIAKSIKAFGFTNPVLIDDADGVIAGHGRVEAAKLLGMDAVPTIRLSNMSDAQKRAYIIADNKLAENAGWDEDLLKTEIADLSSMALDFDMDVIGFETAEIDIMLGADEAVAEAPIPMPPEGAPVSCLGDLWCLGSHRLYCGDALNASSYDALLAGERADAVFTDPPYNVPVNGHVCGKGSIKHNEFKMASGELSEAEFEVFLGNVCECLKAHSTDTAVIFICMDWRHIRPLLNAGANIFDELLNLCVWNKTNGGMGSLYRSKHELVLVFRNGNGPHTNNVSLGRFGRNRTNVWDYAGVNTFSKDRSETLGIHPTVKPVAMVADAILDVTARGDLVLDPFSGSGTTIMAGEQTGRRVAAMELDPKYVDVAIHRFEAATGIEATLTETGERFVDVKARRTGACQSESVV
ncbi:MAG: DNA methyltransferase [Pseudomonadota bacterium]